MTLEEQPNLQILTTWRNHQYKLLDFLFVMDNSLTNLVEVIDEGIPVKIDGIV